jgi:hypothetical protein
VIALIDHLARAEKPPDVFDTPETGRMLVLPEYGRVLGLYAGDSEENFFWTNPALATAVSATEFFRRDGWLNPGGDRSQLWAFRGALAKIAEAQLLGIQRGLTDLLLRTRLAPHLNKGA